MSTILRDPAGGLNNSKKREALIYAQGARAGLYLLLLLPASLVALVSGVLNAWYFLLGPG